MDTRRGLSEEENHIHALLLQMGETTDQAIADALNCLPDHNVKLAQDIINRDTRINALQHQIEEQCLVAIARQQPVAHDLRDLVSSSFIASDLERIADHAADIASIVLQMSAAPQSNFSQALVELGNRCRNMLQKIMTAHSECNAQLAREVAAEDDEVDLGEKNIIADVLDHMKNSSDHLGSTHMLWIVHNIERIGDHITNIAERIVFRETGVNLDLNRS